MILWQISSKLVRQKTLKRQWSFNYLWKARSLRKVILSNSYFDRCHISAKWLMSMSISKWFKGIWRGLVTLEILILYNIKVIMFSPFPSTHSDMFNTAIQRMRICWRVHSKTYRGQATVTDFSCEGYYGDSTNTWSVSQCWYMEKASLPLREWDSLKELTVWLYLSTKGTSRS